ncbi:hypothetical protein SEVIR_2G157133v4 [Setaria viridis]
MLLHHFKCFNIFIQHKKQMSRHLQTTGAWVVTPSRLRATYSTAPLPAWRGGAARGGGSRRGARRSRRRAGSATGARTPGSARRRSPSRSPSAPWILPCLPDLRSLERN